MVAEYATIGVEGCIFFVFPTDLDFVVAFIGVKETFELEAFQGLDL